MVNPELTKMVIISVLLKMTMSSPLYSSQFLSTGNARNIRHLPCVSLRTGETGVCMFAFNCVKANGTHLGTCLDRFYFGSCCKIEEEPLGIFPQENDIEDLLPSTITTTVSTRKPIESNDIPDYSVKPKPERLPTTRRPSTTIAIPFTTTQIPIGLSTFQTVQSSQPSSTKSTPVATTSHIYSTNPQRVSTTSESTTKRPSTIFLKPTSISTFSNDRIPPATRFPPRNSTTTTSTTTTTTTTTTTPTTTSTSTTKKPWTTRIPSTSPTISKPLTSVTKKPTTATSSKKPTTTNRRPPTTSKPSTISSGTTHSSIPHSSTTANLTRPSSPPGIPSKRPSPGTTTHRLTTTPKPSTAAKPANTVTSRPKPSVQSTKPSLTSSGSTKPISRPTIQATAKPKPSLTSIKNPPKPKPTAKPGKPSKPIQTTTKLPESTKAPEPVTTTSPKITTISTVATTTTTTSIPTTMTNEILQSTVTPGIITWSSNSDFATAAPDSSSTFTTQQSQDTSDAQWSPITTPDGWVMIQSPSTKVPGVIDQAESVTKPPKINATVETTESTSTTERVTQRPTLSTSASPDSVIGSSSSSSPELSTQPLLPADRINMSDYKQVCGRRLFPESRIVGGVQSSFGQWPWQISLRQWRTSAFLHKCGAALLNENWAITAAHCVENVPPSDLLLRMGEHDLSNEDEPYGFQERRVQIVASHPQFDPRTFEYDLALLRFYEPLLPFQPNYLPICLPDDDEGYVGHDAYVTGWGRLYEEGPLPSVLQEVSVPVINNTVCESMYRNAGYIEHIPHIFICAGWRDGGFDSCEGDSGGPMVIQRPRDKRWILAGVISWGIGCAEPNQPGVYTRISEFREWINQILQF